MSSKWKKQKWLIISIMTLLIAVLSWQCSKKKDTAVTSQTLQVQSEASADQNAGDVITPPYVAFDEAPAPIGGYSAIQKKIVYPDLARKAGIEGRVVVNVLVNEKGEIVATKILKSLGPNGCDEAAVKAIKSVKWKPAKSKDKSIKVWVSIPVDFSLK